MPSPILVIGGSVRHKRISPQVAEWVAAQYEEVRTALLEPAALLGIPSL